MKLVKSLALVADGNAGGMKVYAGLLVMMGAHAAGANAMSFLQTHLFIDGCVVAGGIMFMLMIPCRL